MIKLDIFFVAFFRLPKANAGIILRIEYDPSFDILSNHINQPDVTKLVNDSAVNERTENEEQ